MGYSFRLNSEWRDENLRDISDTAFRVLADFKSYSSDQETDGVILNRSLVHFPGAKKSILNELIRHGFLVHFQGGFKIKSWEKCITSKAYRNSRRAADSKRKREKMHAPIDGTIPQKIPCGIRSGLKEELRSKKEEELRTPHHSNLNPQSAPAALAQDVRTMRVSRVNPKSAEGSRRLFDATAGVLQWHPGGRWAEQLAEIADKPLRDWEAVAESLRAKVANGEAKYCTPQHVLDHWGRYAERANAQSTVRKASSTPEADRKQAEALRCQEQAALAADALLEPLPSLEGLDPASVANLIRKVAV